MSVSSVVTLASLRLQAQQRADMVNSSFISTTEWNTNISNSYKELYDLLVSAYGNDYYVATPSTFQTDGTNQLFSLPSDFYKLLGVDLQISGRFVTLKPFTFANRNTYFGARSIPDGGQTLQIWYVPEPTNLVIDSDTMDGVSGWEEYVIVDSAIKAGIKEETDISALAQQKKSMVDRLTVMSESRDIGMPATVSDVTRGQREIGMRYRLAGNQIWLAQGSVLFDGIDGFDGGIGWGPF